MDWKRAVRTHASRTGISRLPETTVNELAAHLEDLATAARAEGLSGAAAQQRAIAALEASEFDELAVRAARKAESRAGATAPEPAARFWTGLAGEIRYALRQIRRAPGFAAVSIVTLGLGAGAATAVFTVVDAVVLKPLPFRAPQELVSIWEANLERGLPREPISPVNFMDYRGLRSVFADAAAWWSPEVNLAEPGKDPIRVRAIEASANFFAVLGVSPQLGGGFPQEPALFNRTRLCVISDRLWRQQYGADPSIVGKTLEANGVYAIAGVMPAGFSFPGDVDLWLRLQWDPSQHSRGAHFMEGVARLAPGATAAQAAGELSSLTDRLSAEHPSTNRNWSARPVALLTDMLGYYRPALLVLLGAVAVLLLTACINVAALLLARAGVRGREMALRAAMGASRGRLVRQMFVESLALAGAGTLAGTLAALALVKLAIATTPVSIPRMVNASIDLRVMAFALAVTGSTAILFGLVPALVVSRTRASEALKEGGRSATSARSGAWHRSLVVAEVALASGALVVSALLVKSVNRMVHVPLGVVPDDVLTTTLHLTGPAYRDWSAVEQFYTTYVDLLRRQPGVAAAGVTNALPLEVGWRVPAAIVGRPPVPAGERVDTQIVSASDGYFEVMRGRLIAGRFFDAHDTKTSEPVVIINESFARREFRNQDPLGQHLTSATGIGPLGRHLMTPSLTAPLIQHRIVGVVADIQQNTIGRPAEAVIYHTSRQFPFGAMAVVLRGPDRAALAAAARQTVKAMNPTLALGDFKTMDERLRSASAEPRMLMFVLSSFAVLTAALAAIGVYGLLAWVVNEQRRELAIRLALGATPTRLAQRVTAYGLALAAAGVTFGIVAVQGLRTVLDTVLFQTPTWDPVAIGTAGGVALAAALAASVAPAWRAARVQPGEGLKQF